MGSMSYIGEWNRKHEKTKTICSRVDVFANLHKVDQICYGQTPIITVNQNFHLVFLSFP